MAGAFYESRGTGVAPRASVARRVMAFLAMVAIVIIVLAVMVSVYHHHRTSAPTDETTIVMMHRGQPGPTVRHT